LEERFTPRMSVDFYVAQRGITIADLAVAPTVIVSWARKVVDHFVERFEAEVCSHWLHADRNPLFSTEIEGRKVSFSRLPLGAPGTVAIMEQMIACGAQRVIGLGFAGSLRASAPVGAMIIPTGCVREEGTSFHYVKDEARLKPDEGLVKGLREAARAAGAAVVEGSVWTTDAPFRELVSKIEKYGEQGVLGVDMETSAMYALGQYRGIEVANLLVVSDELWDEWRPAFRTAELRTATALAQKVVARYITNCLHRDEASSG
jgi:uridine phosphorylase